jgi:hypothetical protein
MGVSNTETEYKAQVSIDWVSGTVLPATGYSLPDVLMWFTPPGQTADDWTALDRGAMGYKSCFERAGMRVYHDGTPGMGFHAVVSGKAVRQLEHEQGLFCEQAWQAWLGDLSAKGFKFTRVDVAFDDVAGVGGTGVLDMGVIFAAVQARDLVTPFHKARRRREDEYNLHESAGAPCAEGSSIKFGSRTSNMFVRIYDKAQEQLLPADFHWIRVEQEFKKENAVKFVEWFLRFGFASCAELLKTQLDFKVSSCDSNKSRWVTVAWWDTFLVGCSKARLRPSEVVSRTIDNVKAWVTLQAPSLALYFDAIYKECLATGADYRRAKCRALDALLEGGRGRYKSKHLRMLADYVPFVGFGV